MIFFLLRQSHFSNFVLHDVQFICVSYFKEKYLSLGSTFNFNKFHAKALHQFSVRVLFRFCKIFWDETDDCATLKGYQNS